MIKFRLVIVSMMVVLLSGCALFETVGPVQAVIHDDHQEMVSTINKKLEDTSELYDSVIIATKDKTLVSYKVHHLNRFKMKSIEKKLTKWLEKEYPDEKIEVSSDFKIFLESYHLFEAWSNDNLSLKEAEKKLDKIVKLKKELT